MEKNEFVLQVILVQDIADNDIREGYEEVGATISITAWDNAMNFMIDQHITEFHPDLILQGIEELCEGDIIYYGNLNKQQLINLLVGLDFVVYDTTNEQLYVNNIELGQQAMHRPNQPNQPRAINREQLEREMQQAIAREDYERAAQIRDILNGEI
jgi:hypothetical protein